MPDAKISAVALGATPADGDLFAMIDVSDTTMAPTGSNKHASYAEIKAGISAGGQTLYDIVVAPSGGDYTTLGGALAVATAGQSIYVRAGTYAESTITTALNNLTIVGESNQTSILSIGTSVLTFSGTGVTIQGLNVAVSTGRIVLSGANATMLDCNMIASSTPASAAFISSTATDCTIRGLNISSSVPNTTRSGASIIASTATRFRFLDSFMLCTPTNSATNQTLAALYLNGSHGTVANSQFYSASGINQTVVVRIGSNTVVTGNTFHNLGGTGIWLSGGANSVVTGNTMECPTTTIPGYGIYVESATNTVISNNNIRAQSAPTFVPINLNSSASNTTVSNNVIGANSTAGIVVAGTGSIITGNRIIRGAAGTSITVTGEGSLITNNNLNGWGATVVTPITDSTTTSTIIDNYYQVAGGIVPIANKRVDIYKNSSGGAFASGAIVVLKATATGYEVTTSTTAGDNKVVGVALYAFGDTESAYVQTLGKTTVLKVDGTSDIAIGDFISCHTVAGVGAKASAGHTAIAIALEAYTADNSNGVIDALIIPPRMV